MQKLKHSRLFPITGLLLGMLVWLANNGNPPTGNTGAPFNGNCNNCHSGGNYNGNIDVSGFPATASPNETYDITLTTTVTSGNPNKAGFQLVVVDANNANCGDLIDVAGNGTGTENLAMREYIEHRNGKNFAGGTVSWSFQWKAPASVPGDLVKVYYIVNMCNGNGGTGGDNPIWDNFSFGFSGPPPLTANISNTENPTCNGLSDGSATVEAEGGNPPYTYLWTGGQTTQTAVNLPAGTYTVTVTATGGGGTATAVATLSQPPSMTLSTSVSGTVTCVNTASATATAGGGTPGFNYEWSDGQTGSTVFFDEPGTYSVTATDANGCTRVATANVPGNIIPPVANAEAGGELTCTIVQKQLSGAGSSTGNNFSYLWTTSNGNIVSGANTLFPTVNACGTYLLTVTDNTNGCTATASSTVTCNTAQPDASATGGALTCSSPCLNLMGSSATPGVIFSWSGPGITPGNQNEQNPEVCAAGTYTLTVTDTDNGCTRIATATVTEDFNLPMANGSVSGQLTCVNTSVQLNLSTDIPNPVFAWAGPNGFSSNIANPSISTPGDYFGTVTNPSNGCSAVDTVTVAQNIALPGASAAAVGQINCLSDTVQLLGNSPAAPNVVYAWTGLNFSSNLQNPVADTVGSYTLIVTGNANGCTSSAVAVVMANILAPFDSIVPPDNLNCENNVVQLNATPSSQGPNFEYQWTATAGGHIVSGDTTLTPVVDSTGKYFLVITNTTNGCTAVDSVVVMQSLPVLAVLDTLTNVSCQGGSNGSASISGSGGNGSFTYLWSNGSTNASISGLAAGTYMATVTDGETCTASISVSISQPALLQANATATGETSLEANDGTATAAPIGGTPDFDYIWSNGATTASISELEPGSYTVSVVDANGCSSVQTVTVNAFGCALQATVTVSNVSCNGNNDGLASLSLTGAIDPVMFNWSNGESTQSVNNLAPGIYTVSVLDGNNCPSELSLSINEPPVLSANATATGLTAPGANDGTATAAPTGGTPGYAFVWSNGATTQQISGLAPDTYTVSVTDANGCTVQQTVTVLAFNCVLSASISAANAQCFGSANGQATIAVNGGALPYSYQWSNGATNQTATNLMAGTYTATATDAAGCSITQSVNVGQPAQLEATVVNVQNVLCPQDKTGSAEIAISGGTAPYSIFWPGGNTSNLGVGSYTVSVTDANNCTTTAAFSIISTDNEGPIMTCPAEIAICGANIVDYPSATAFDNCGVATPPSVISGPASGSIFLDGTTVIVFEAADHSGNTSRCSFSIIVNVVPDILIDEILNDMNGQGVGAISVTAVGSGGFSYAWNRNGLPFANTEDLIGLTAGIYSLTITDLNSCTSALAPITISNTVGATEPGLSGSVRLWPNPAQSSIQLEIIDLDVIAASIVDLRGRLVQQIQPTALRSEIGIEQLPEGVYCLKLSGSGGQVLSLKFMVVR